MAANNVYPYFAKGVVVKGFGRGSKELGIPTANFEDSVVDVLPKEFECAVYYGWASVDDSPVYGMVMSIGTNPFYNNTKRTMETHILHDFENDFYGSLLRVCVCGFIRDMTSFNSVDELIDAIQGDIALAKEKLNSHTELKESDFFKSST